MNERFLRLPEVLERTGLCRSAVFLGQKQGTFPRAIKIFGRCTAWTQSSINAWIERTIAASMDSDQRDAPTAASSNQADRSAAA
jgi:prophage regulatory protein